MANPFYTDVNATSALVGGESATDAFGFPQPRSTAGLRAPNPQIKAAQDELRTLQAQVDARRQPRQKPPVIGYNPETDTIFSAGKEFDASNLTVMDSYDKAGFFDVDNNGKLPPGYLPYSPDQVRAWMQSEAQSRGAGFRTKEVAKQVYSGVGDLINSGVKSINMLAPKDSWLERSTGAAVEEYDRSNEGNTPDVYGATDVGKGFTGAARSFAPSIGTGVALAVNPLLGGTMLGMMGGGTAYDTYQEALRQGVSPEEAMAAARRTGAIEAIGEGVADRFGMGLMKGAGKVAAGLRIPTLRHGTKVATDLLANAALQSGTEMGQAYGQRRVEEAYGISGQDPMQAALEAGEQGLYLSAMMAPLGIAGGYANRPRPAPQLPPQAPPPAAPTTAVGFPAPPSGPFTPVTPIPNPPDMQFGAYEQPALPAPAPQQPYDPNTIVVTPGGTAAPAGTTNAFSGIQPDMFGGPDQFGQQPQAEQEQPASTPDTQTQDLFDGQIAAMVKTDFSPEQLRRQLGWSKGARLLAQRLSAALGNQAEVDAILAELNNSGKFTIKNPQTKGRSVYEMSTATVEAANDIVSRFQSRMNDALAQEGVARAQPGVTVGQAPGTQDSAELMRQQSDAMLEEETAPDFARSTPNEMPADLVKEKGPKGPAQTLALRGQTQAQLDELNAREQWTQGPAERQPGAPAIPANQLALFDLKGQPTNPAMGVPLPKSEKPAVSEKRQKLKLPKDKVATTSEKPSATDKAGPKESKAAENKPAENRAAEPTPVRTKKKATPKFVPKSDAAPRPLSATEQLQADMEAAAREARREEAPEAPADVKARLKARLTRLDNRKVTLDSSDYAKISDAIEAGDTQEAMERMAEIERAMLNGLYRTSDGKATSFSRKLLDIAIRRVEKLLGGKINIIVMDSVTEFDSTQKPGSRSGAYQDGKVYIFLDGLKTIVDAQQAIFHELFHRGNAIRHKDAGYQQSMRRLYNQSAKVRNATNAWIASERGKDARKTYPNNDEYLAVAVDEALAETAEGLANPGMVRTIGNWMAEIADWMGLKALAKSIREMGQGPLEKFIRETMEIGRDGGDPGGGARYSTTDKFAPDFKSVDTKSESFKRWFKRSKVVDANGEPLVVYHGTTADFSQFEKREATHRGGNPDGFYFSTSSLDASEYTENSEYDRTAKKWNIEQKDGGNVMPVYLSIQHPFVEGSRVTQAMIDLFEQELRKQNPSVSEMWVQEKLSTFKEKAKSGGNATAIWPNITFDNDAKTRVLQAGGYDGFQDGRHWVVFDATQIKSAISNTGDFSSTHPDIRYRTVPSFTGSGPSRILDVLRYDFGGALRRGVLHSSFLTDITDRFSDKLKGLKEYTERSHAMGATAARLQAQASAVQGEFQKLSAKERDQLSDFMGRVTEANVNVEGNNPHLGTNQAEATALKAEFAKLSPQQKTAYRKTRDQLRDNWNKRGELLERETKQLFKPLIEEAMARGDFKKAAELKREQSAFLRENQKVLSQMQGDYFPLMRFGNHRVVHKSAKFLKVEAERDAAYEDLQALITKLDTRTPEERKIFAANNKKLKAAGKPVIPEFSADEQKQIDDAKQRYNDLEDTLSNLKGNEADYYMAQFESESEARADLARLGKTNAYYSRVAEFHRELNPISRAMMRRMEESLAMTLRGSGNASAVIEAKKAMMEIYLSSLPDMSAMRRQMKRRNVAGYHKDMTRSIAASMLQDSFHLSRLEHMEDVKEAMLEVRREADDAARSGAEDGARLQEVAEQIERRFAADQRRTDTPVQDTLAGIGWLYNLAVSPAYIITNLMQPGMITMPMLAARHRAFPTMRAMRTAWADTAKMVVDSIKTNWKGDINFEKANISEKEKEMLRKMLESQLLTVSLVSDLSATADGKGISRITQFTALPAHHAEVVNRIGSALAAYRLEMAASGNHEQAIAYAAKVLDQTHFNYSTENAPYWMKPGAGVVPMAKVVLQFRKYTIGMVSLYARTVAAAVKGESQQVKTEARRQLLALLTAQQLMAGAAGLPVAFPLAILYKIVAGAFGDDEPDDLELDLRNALTDLFGKPVSTALVKGLPSAFDLDLSSRVGSGNLLNPVPYMRSSDTPRGQYSELLLALAGPTLGGVIPNFYDGLNHMVDGNALRGFESMLPKAIRDVTKSYRFVTEGVTTRGGDTIRGAQGGFEGMWEGLLTASGFTPTDVADAYAANAAIQNKRTWFKDSRESLVREWLEADDKDAVMKDVQKYNALARESNLKPITLGDLMRARMLQQRRNASYAKYGSNLPRSEVGLSEEGRFAEVGKE